MEIPEGKKADLKSKNKNITYIDLENLALNDNDIQELVDMLEENPCITSINLRNNNITYIGAAALATCRLQKLDLRDNKIGNKGAEVLLKSMTIKEKLLSGNGITDDVYLKYQKQFENDFITKIKLTPDEKASLAEVANLNTYIPTDSASFANFKVKKSESNIAPLKDFIKAYLPNLKALGEKQNEALEMEANEIIKKFQLDNMDEQKKLALLLILAKNILNISGLSKESDYQAK